jgi:membrane protein DedA with SNARE-associated domain/rhodanese-related sulfurtransferase
MASPIGLSVIFLNVLCNQLGLPVPVLPTLIVAGAMAADGRLPAAAVFGLAVAGCVCGDVAWYVAGRIFGGRVMKLLCKVSLTPDTCVSQTETRFERHGPKVLIVAKFIPGLSLVAPPLAGATRMGVVRFLCYSALAAALWVSAALIIGLLLRAQVDWLLHSVAGLIGAAVTVLLLLGGYVAFKGYERYRFNRALDMARIGVTELYAHLGTADPPVLLDVRSPTAAGLQPQRIPGALQVALPDVALHLGKLPRDRDIILYCACPNEASAAKAAKILMAHGYRRVRPLRGGLDAWIAAGYAVEPIVAAPPASAAGVTLAQLPAASQR